MPFGTVTTFSAYPPEGVSEQAYWDSRIAQVSALEPDEFRKSINRATLLKPEKAADLVMLTIPQGQRIYEYLDGQITLPYLNRMHMGPVLLSAVPDLLARTATLPKDGIVSGQIIDGPTVAHVRLIGPNEIAARNSTAGNNLSRIRNARREDVLKLQETPWLGKIVTEAQFTTGRFTEQLIDYARLESVWLGFVVKSLTGTAQHPWFS